jgi:hypothetical protein
MTDYKIGTTLAGITALTSLTTPLPVPRVSEPVCELEKLGNRLYREMGLPGCTWTWPQLTTAELAQLRVFCTGASSVVYMRTLVQLNALSTYATYKAVMVWASGFESLGGFNNDVVIKFEEMEVQT